MIPIDDASSPDSPGPAGSPLISVVIVNYNSWSDVESLVLTLSRSPEVLAGRVEVVVVDNASEGSMPSLFLAPPDGARLINRCENGGFAVGVNAGWRASRGSWILLVNPDVVVPDGWLGRVVAMVEGLVGPGTPGVVGLALRNPDGSPQYSVGAFPSLARAFWEQFIPRSRRKYQAAWRTKSGPVDWVTGACILVGRRVLEDVGGLDEDFFLYYEEVAFCRSARRLGWRVEYNPDPAVAVVHLRPLQVRVVNPRMRVITRHSKLLYFRKHLPRWQFLGLCAIVAVEARTRGFWARIQGQAEERRAWGAVAFVERELRGGRPLAGRAVLALADSVVEPNTDEHGAAGTRRASTRQSDEPRTGASLRL